MSGGISSGIGSGIDALGGSAGHQILGGGLGGGIGSAISGGNFWQGFGQGIAVGAFNHSLHSGGDGGDDPPKKQQNYDDWIKSMKQKFSSFSTILSDNPILHGGMTFSGYKFNFIKSYGYLGSARGSSFSSYFSRKIPGRFTTIFGNTFGKNVAKYFGTNMIGGAVGRTIPFIGWGLLYNDLYNYSFSKIDTKNPYDVQLWSGIGLGF